MLYFLLACTASDQSLSRTEILTRVSLDLRGIRPSIEELEGAERSTRSLNSSIDKIMETEAFGSQFARAMAGVWRTEVVELDHTDNEEYSVPNPILLITSMGEEPLRMLEEIANEDLHYSEFVTGDWTMNNEILAAWAPVEYPEEATGWQKVRYTDGRPAAGVLASNGLWWRYSSTQNNANRGRANIVSKNLLCNDYLQREITVDRDLNLLDEDAVQDALRNSPSCYSCHSSLDPLAANFWGFYRHFRFSPDEQFSYHPERERDWVTYSGVGPGYFGESIQSLEQLGRQIADDPRYYECLTERMMEQLYHRPLGLGDQELKNEHARAFADGGHTIRALISSIITDPNYLDSQNDLERKIVTPALFASQLENLTNYRYSHDSMDTIQTDLFGLRSMAGGVGEDYSQESFQSPSPTFSLVIERLAQSAAYHATHDETAANLFFDFDFQMPESASDENFQLVFRKVISRQPDEEELQLLHDLWNDIYALDQSSVDAWEMMLSFLFRHPEFLSY